MRNFFFETLALLLVLVSLAIFYAGIRFLQGHDYAAGLVTGVLGVAILHVAAEMARLALVDRQ